MATITNKLGLPAAIVEAIRNDKYPYGSVGDISASALIAPPRKRALERLHRNAIEEDASDRIWALVGQAVHTILERAEPSELVEKRLFARLGGWSVSGQFDRLHVRNGVLQDYKITSVWSAKEGAKVEWVGQLNVLAELCEVNGYEIERTEIVAIYRDWRKREAEQNAEYPQAQVAVVEIPLWPRDQRRRFIEERVAAHRAALIELPECSDDDRWARGRAWAVMKEGSKRAVKGGLFSDMLQAHAFADAQNAMQPEKKKGAFYVEERPPENTRCESYCPVVRWCEQARKLGVRAAQPAGEVAA